MSKEERMQYLIRLLNEAIQECDPIYYSDFNKNIYETEDCKLEKLESINPKLGIKSIGFDHITYGMSTLSIIATVTDVLVDDRLAVLVDDKGIITGFQWTGDTSIKEEAA